MSYPVNIITYSEPITTTDSDNESQNGTFHTTQVGEQTVLLALDTQDALALRHVQDRQGKLDITLHTDDVQSAEVTPVDQYYLANRYGIKMAQGEVAIGGYQQVAAPIYPPDAPTAYPPRLICHSPKLT